MAVFFGYTEYWPGGFIVLCVCDWGVWPGAPEGSTGSGFDFKASQKTGPRLRVSFKRLGDAGNRTSDPRFT